MVATGEGFSGYSPPLRSSMTFYSLIYSPINKYFLSAVCMRNNDQQKETRFYPHGAYSLSSLCSLQTDIHQSQTQFQVAGNINMAIDPIGGVREEFSEQVRIQLRFKGLSRRYPVKTKEKELFGEKEQNVCQLVVKQNDVQHACHTQGLGSGVVGSGK